MTPSEKKKKKRTQILRVAIPVLLAGLFASLALLESNGVFAAVNKARPAAAEEHPAPVPVPFTRLSVLNRLENDGFLEKDGFLLRNDSEAGMLSLEEEDGALKSVGYSLILLPSGDAFAGSAKSEMIRAQNEADSENAHLVFRAVVQAMLGGTEPKQTQLEQGEKKLDRCLTSSGEKEETFTLAGCTVSFAKAYTDGLYVLTMKAVRE